MLVLGRKPGQKIIVAGEIEIVVLEVRGEHVRLGINAPREVTVYRQEMLDRIAAENSEAADSAKATCVAPENLAAVHP